MRSTLFIAALLSLVLAVSAAPGFAVDLRRALTSRQKRAGAPAAQGQTPGSTPAGSPRPQANPFPACSSRGGYKATCNPVNASCCGTGFKCLANACEQLCPIDTNEAFCDATTPCNAALGNACTQGRCRPPATSTRVNTGDTCNQGGANTLFCFPGKSVCVNSICRACTH